MKNKYDRIIIGAGASGLFAASLSNHTHGLIIEHNANPGQKLLISGSGQCNITHGGSIKDFITHYGNHGRIIRSILYQGSNEMLISHMTSLGIPLFERADGKVFPQSMKALDVKNALLKRAIINGYELALRENIKSINHVDNTYTIETDCNTYQTPVLIIASGGRSYPGTGSDGSMFSHLEDLGISIRELSPALVPIYVESYGFKEISGVSFEKISVSLDENGKKVKTVIGDLLLTHKGYSGPAILDISRDAKPGMILEVNYVYPKNKENITSMVKKTYQKSKKKTATYLSGLLTLPQSFCEAYLKTMGIDPSMKASALTGDDIAIISKLSSFHAKISRLGSFREAMVTKGGVSLDSLNTKTMESKDHKNLYFIGEVVDIDGDTGGYNLQFAFSSAAAAIRSIEKAG